VIEASRHSDKLPPTRHPRPRHATQGVANPGVRHVSTINSISHRLERGSEENSPCKPSDAGDRGHSKPVYLLPSSVRKRDSGTCAGRGITDVRTPAQSRTTSLPHPVRWDMPPVLMSIPGFEPQKGCRVCRINEPAPPGHSFRLKQKKEKGAVRRCHVQSESSLLHRKHRRVRPHHHAQTVRSDFWLAVNRSFSRLCRLPGARKQEESKAASQRRE